MANVQEKATAITVLSPLRTIEGRFFPTLTFWAGRGVPWLVGPVDTLSFIHFARWTLIDSFPGASKGKSERLRYRYLLFESNFNGTWEQYIDAFSEAIPWRMRAVWQTSFGFPGPIPVAPFKDYIRQNEFVANHYWSAYGGYPTTEILAATRIADDFDALLEQSTRLDAADFAVAYEEFLTDHQRDL